MLLKYNYQETIQTITKTDTHSSMTGLDQSSRRKGSSSPASAWSWTDHGGSWSWSGLRCGRSRGLQWYRSRSRSRYWISLTKRRGWNGNGLVFAPPGVINQDGFVLLCGAEFVFVIVYT